MRYGLHAFDCTIKVLFMPTINLIFYFVVLQGGFPLCRFINLQFLHEGVVVVVCVCVCVLHTTNVRKQSRKKKDFALIHFNYVSLIK